MPRSTPSVLPPTPRLTALAVAALSLALALPAISGADAPEPPAPAPTTTVPAKPRPIEVFALVGTATSDNCEFAMFSGNYPEYRIMLAPGEKIAEYTLKSVGFDHVRLANGSEEIELSILKELRRDKGGPWRVANRQERLIPRETSPLTESTNRRPESKTAAAQPAPDADGKRSAADKVPRKLEKALADAPVKPSRDEKPTREDKRAAERTFSKKIGKLLRREAQ